MNRLFYRYCLCILLLLGSWQSAQAQGGDPFCHLQVISGAPAWFDFNKASDYTAGKTLYYNTVIKVQFNKRPDKIWVYSTAESNTFDGPTSGLASSNFFVVIKDFQYSGSGSNIMGRSLEDSRPLTTAKTLLGYFWLNSTPEDQPVFYLSLTFSCRPNDAEAFTRLQTGAYTNIDNIHLETLYRND